MDWTNVIRVGAPFPCARAQAPCSGTAALERLTFATSTLLVLFVLFFGPGLATAQTLDDAKGTERLMLSGHGIEDAVPWEFFCTEGRQSGEWTTLPVPSLWEQHGFGSYNYGHDDDPSREQGLYRHRFEVPETWEGQRVELIFEGVMTDAEVKVNGTSAGNVHRGAFYRFSYDVSDLLDYGSDNLLEVTVRKHSTDKKVNAAERDADYWIFGGIFRPVYLEAKAPESIDRWAIDAKHDGAFTAEVTLRAPKSAATLHWWVAEATSGELVAEPRSVDLVAGQNSAQLTTQFSDVLSWSAETPHLYRLHMELRRGEEVLHHDAGRFGFRTFEVHRTAGQGGPGLFVNGQRVRLKGINRHVFWPSSGRASWPRRDRLDVEALKSLNLNAVRASHYPPDVSFLEACDELGLYVLDELAGWHDAYGTKLGRQLVRDMVERDVNHPSILFWNNGNEGGWNKALVNEYDKWDPQQRPVLHPDELLGDVQTQHYPTWDELEELLDESTWRDRWFGLRGIAPPLVMPTEMLHGLYDGGSGAGLATYWQRLTSTPQGVGAFLWSFTDESIERSDRNGALDSDGNHAPDGVLGPYREWSATASAVQEVFSPVSVDVSRWTAEGARLFVHNRFDHLNLSQIQFAWQRVVLPRVVGPGATQVLEWGHLAGPNLAAGQDGEWVVPVSTPNPNQALRLAAFDPAGRHLMTWTWPGPAELRPFAVDTVAKHGSVEAPSGASVHRPATAVQQDGRWRLQGGDSIAEIDLETGQLVVLGTDGRLLELPGPTVLGAGSSELSALRQRSDDGVQIVEAMGRGPLQRWRWEMHPNGWLKLSYTYRHPADAASHGIDFALPWESVRGLEWLGPGPGRIWANRREGTTLGHWHKASVPESDEIWGHEPKLRGFYGKPHWLHLQLDDGELQVAFERRDLDLGFFVREFPEDAEEAKADVVPSNLAFMGKIPGIGTKFHASEELEPEPYETGGEALAHGVVWLRWQPR